MSRVLVALDREDAETRVCRRAGSLDEAISANRSLDMAIRAALDTDREETARAVAGVLAPVAWRCREAGCCDDNRELSLDKARAVLDLLENGGQE